MKKIIVLLLCGVFAFTFSACKEEAKVNGTVELAVNNHYTLSNLFKANDSVYSIKIKNPSGKELKIDSTKIVFDKLGTYEFIHADGSITKLKVFDNVAPTIRFNFTGYVPKIGVETSLPITVIDNFGDASLSVMLNGTDIGNNKFTPTADGASLLVKATDANGNLNSVKVELKPIGNTVSLNKSIFENLDQQKNYTFSYRITEYSAESSQTYLGSSFTVKKDKNYSVTAIAKSGMQTITAVSYYIPLS